MKTYAYNTIQITTLAFQQHFKLSIGYTKFVCSAYCFLPLSLCAFDDFFCPLCGSLGVLASLFCRLYVCL